MFRSSRRAVRIGALGKKMLLLTCAATAVGVAAPQLASAAEPVPGAPGHPSLRGLCNATSITGKIANQTGVTMTLASASHGITNAWCTYPDAQILAYQGSTFEAGDNFFGTSVTVTYNISGGWSVTFMDSTDGTLDCDFDGLGTNPYGCDIESDGSGLNYVEHFLVWTSASLTHHPGPRTSHPHKGHGHIPPGRHNQHQPSHRTED
jgi:hypothetical protein